jgi:glycosyltransferase involved in cell wall biosynthesis
MRVLVVTHHLAPELLVLWRACAATPGVDLHLAGTLDAPSGEAFVPRTELPVWAPAHVFTPRDLTGRGVLWWAYPGLSKLVRDLRPDVVHVNGEPWAVLVTQALRSRSSVVVHGADNMFGHGSLAEAVVRRAVTRRNLRRAAAYVSWNAAGAALARTHGLRPSAPTLVAPATVPDPARFAGLPRTERPYTVGFLGRLTPLKGAPVLAAAARAAEVPRVVIAGDGPVRDGLDGAELVGPVDHADVPAFLAGLDVLVVPSLTTPTGAEQFGRVAVEAMWAGTPVVVSDSGALPEVVGDGGVVVPEGDAAALARVLRELASTERRNALRVAGLARVRAAYDPAVLAARVVELWRAA